MKNIFKKSFVAITMFVSSIFAIETSANSYVIKGQRYYPIAKSQVSGYVEKGKASWYGGYFHGRKAANGSIYDVNKYTAAHKTLPFGTKVKVTNVKNGKSVNVVITDRGPFAKGKIIDLTPRAFNAIGNTRNGIMNVKIEVIQ